MWLVISSGYTPLLSPSHSNPVMEICDSFVRSPLWSPALCDFSCGRIVIPSGIAYFVIHLSLHPVQRDRDSFRHSPLWNSYQYHPVQRVCAGLQLSTFQCREIVFHSGIARSGIHLCIIRLSRDFFSEFVMPSSITHSRFHLSVSSGSLFLYFLKQKSKA